MNIIAALIAVAFWPFVFVWLLSAIAAGMIYADRGRRGRVGFLGGLVFGPFGVVLTLLTPVDRFGQERRLLAQGYWQRCAECAELVRIEARICSSCRAELPISLAPPARVPLLRIHRTDTNQIAIEMRRLL